MAEHRIHDGERGGRERETRAQSGVRLFREHGDEITMLYVGGIYSVPSRTKEGTFYHVVLGTGHCECPDNQYRGETCAHLVAAECKRVELRRRRKARRGSLLERYRHELMDEDQRLELEEQIRAGVA